MQLDDFVCLRDPSIYLVLVEADANAINLQEAACLAGREFNLNLVELKRH